MEVKPFNGSPERSVLIGMITDETVLGRIASKWEDKMFSSRWANVVAEWCVAYYKKYKYEPGKNIERLYYRWANKTHDEETKKLVADFLSSLSDEYEHHNANPDFIIDQAGELFNTNKAQRLVDTISGCLAMGKADEAMEAIHSFRKVEIGVGAGIDLLNDEEAVKSTFAQQESIKLIEFPGGVGRFFGNSLERDGFIGVMAPDKTGKSQLLQEFAYRGVSQRRRVAFFAVGDMSERQMKMRFLSRFSGIPVKSSDGSWPYSVQWPSDIKLPENGGEESKIAHVDFETKVFDKALNGNMSWDACEKFMSKKVKSSQSFLKLSCHFNSSINVEGIEEILGEWERDGWTADVVIIDYADILAPPYGKMEPREEINTTWKQMRALSQKKHCLVITASQSDAEAYDRYIITRRNFSGDKRKLAHVTGMMAINVTNDEKEIGVARYNWIVLREGEYTSNRCCHVAGCLAVARPIIVSAY